MKLVGPFTELLTMDHLPSAGPIKDHSLEIVKNAGLVIHEGVIHEVGVFDKLKDSIDTIIHLDSPTVAIPGLIDSHTHLCWSGSRADEYAMRLDGKNYQEIAKAGGGILTTVTATRAATEEQLICGMVKRAKTQLKSGITTCEVKSGYGLNVNHELKSLRAIHKANQETPIDLIPTCLAAHVIPPEFGNETDYLEYVTNHIFPALKEHLLTNRIDIFVEKGAFSIDAARHYLSHAKKEGFAITMHANQFSTGAATLAAELKALSADHLEEMTEEEALQLAQANVVATVLPGATFGLGQSAPPSRMLLDAGATLAIASDWNPGSAPMGDLLTLAALHGAQEKLTTVETLAAITIRAAKALALTDRGVLKKGMRADLALFPTNDYREILYHQGMLKPKIVYIGGVDATEQ